MAPQPVTEMAFLPLKAGSKPEDPDTSEGKIFQEALNTLAQQPGYRRCCYGRQVEDGSKLVWFIDWDEQMSHQTFMKSDAYAPFLKSLGTLKDGTSVLYHAALDPPSPKSVCSAPATEVLTIYFPSDKPAAEQEAHANNLKKMGEAFKGIEGCFGLVGGWILEELPCEGATGGKSKAFACLVGWASVEAHTKGRSSTTFKENIHLVNDTGAFVDRAMFHVNFTEV